MTTERWQQIQQVFLDAAERPAAERASFLDTACDGDAALRAEVESLLAADAALPPLLEPERSGHATGLAALLEESADAEEPAEGERVGPYRLVEEIGRGGMGTIYRAERADGLYERAIALKLVRPGLSPDLVRRFRAERQILASLEHPHIARLYDGGVTEDGRPYLAMEFVEGHPLDRYCDEKELGVDERLRLFLRVGEAVAFAHRNLVVHRDLKPSNILVTDEGEVKLLDFGIAKLLEEAGDEPLTRTGMRPMTPAYAAPEQIKGEAITTATDVYALSVVLYELLVGRRPYDADSDFEAARAVLEAEPARPSTAVTRATTRTHRDGTTETLAPETLSARRSTTPERLRRRRRGDLDAILLKALRKEPEARYPSAEAFAEDVRRHLDGLPVAARQGSQAYQARKFVQRHRWGLGVAALLVLSLAGGLAAALWQAREAARERDTAREVAAFVETLLAAADPDAPDAERLDTLRVRDLLDRGTRQVRAELAGQPRVQASLLDLLGGVNTRLGRFEDAEPLLRDALATRRRLYGDRSTEVAETQRALALLAFSMGDYDEALALRRDALATEQHLGESATLAEAENDLALSLRQAGEADEAEAHYQEALRLLRTRAPSDRAYYVEVLNNLATLYYDEGDYPRAEALIREAHDVLSDRFGPRHPKVGIAANNIASIQQFSGRVAEAERYYDEALSIFEEAYGPDHSLVATALANLALIYDEQGRYDEADTAYVRAIAIEQIQRGSRHPDVALTMRNRGLTLFDAGRAEAAERVLREALSIAQEAFPDGHLYVYVTQQALGKVLTVRGSLDEAGALLRAGLEGLEAELPEAHYLVAGARRDWGGWLAANGRYDEAEPILLSAYAALRATLDDDDSAVRDARRHLAELYEAWGQPERAAAYRTQPADSTS